MDIVDIKIERHACAFHILLTQAYSNKGGSTMKVKQVVVIVALLLSVCFGALYIRFFSTVSEKVDIYACQVGIYKEQGNADSMIASLKAAGLNGYSYQKEDTIIVVSDIFLTQEAAKELGTKISEKQISCVIKEYQVDKKYQPEIEKKTYDTVLKELGK